MKLSMITSQTPNFDTIEESRSKFVNDYNFEALKTLKIDNYAMGGGRKDNFCYRLEREQDGMGRITGAQSGSARFGVWYDETTSNYKFAKKYGASVNEAYNAVRQEILSLISAGGRDDFKRIRESKLSPLVRYKILAMYYPNKYLTIFSLNHLTHFCEKAGMVVLESDDELILQMKLLQWKESQSSLSKMSMLVYVNYLYNHFGRPPKTKNTSYPNSRLGALKKDLIKFDRIHAQKKLTQVEINQRSGKVRDIVKERAKGICQLCRKPAPFFGKDGEPFLECHHIVWLSRGGADEINNAVALCPNCHRKMHNLDDKMDIARLMIEAKK